MIMNMKHRLRAAKIWKRTWSKLKAEREIPKPMQKEKTLSKDKVIQLSSELICGIIYILKGMGKKRFMKK
jgi:hypothetical protein